MQHSVIGTTMPVLEFTLDHNDTIISEAGELSWMGASIQMTTHTQFAGGGGIFGAIKRVAGGGSLFMTEYRAIGAPGELAFATRCQDTSFLSKSVRGATTLCIATASCAARLRSPSASASSSRSAQASSAAIGFILQHVTGQGTAWLELSGEVVAKDLRPAKPSASIPVTSEPSSPASTSRSPASPASAT